MQSDSVSEYQLVRRITQSEDGALQEFYDLFADPLFGFIYHHMQGERAEAEEVWQDTLLAALHALPAYRAESRLFTWLCAIARHKIIDHYRKQGSRKVQEVCHIPAEMLAKDVLPEEALLSNGVRSHVIETLYALPDEYRKALTTRYLDGRSVVETAERLGKSYKATEALLSRARAAFQTAFGGTQDE